MLKHVFLFLLLAGSAIGQTITDPGFETPAQGQGKFAYRPTGSAWTFAGSSGLAGNASGFTNGSPAAPQGSQVAFLQNAATVSQSVKAWPEGDYQISFRAAQRAWPPAGSNQTISVLIDGNLVSTIKPSTTTYQLYYTTSVSVAAGDHVLSFQGPGATTDNSAFIDSVNIFKAGSVAPQVTATAVVCSSGKMIAFSFNAIGAAPQAIPTQILSPPSITVCGQPLGPLGTQWLTGYHPVVLLTTPNNYQIRPGDAVKLTAPIAWAVTGSGFCQSFDNTPAENRAGQPMLATETLARTLRIGINNNQSPTSSGLGFYFPFKNLKYRVGWPPSNRGKISAGQGSLTLENHGAANGIDQTKYPSAAGLWCVMWDAVNPAKPVQLAITSATPAQCTVTERVDLARAPPDGMGMCRVFDVQPIATAPSADFDVSLAYADPANGTAPAYNNLWVCQPGDFDIAASSNQVILDRSDPFALSRIYLDRVGPNVGSLRWVDSTVCGGNPVSCPYPEFLPNLTDENWGDLSFVREVRGYVAAGPVDVTATPFLYSPFFRQPSQQFTATLGADVTTAPAPGIHETWTFTDGATAPLMAGLEVTIDQETCRILNGSGTSWTVVRGSNGTTPATHTAGSLSVSGRRPIRDVLNALGGMNKGLVTQLTTQQPHGRTTGNVFTFDGGGWPNIAYTDGTTWNMQGFGRPCYVTGPTTCFLVIGSTAAGGVPKQVYPLDPARQQWDYRNGAGIPIEAAAIATGRFAKADFHVNIPLDACDDMVWEIAKRVLANFPSGRRVYVEYGNEPWNWAFNPFYYHTAVMGPLAVPGNPYQLAHYAYRAGQVHAIFRKVFGAAGRDKEIWGLINCQMGSGTTQVTPHLELGLAQATPFDAVAVAPYWSFENTPLNQSTAARLDDEQFTDVIGADMRTNPRANNASMADVNKALSAYNSKHSTTVKLIGYEGGIEFANPWDMPRNHDLIYNPCWYFTELDWLAWCQQQGFDRIHIYDLAMWWAPQGWGGYHTAQQRHSRGDGLNGAVSNQVWKRGVRPPGINQDQHTDSVRGQAWLDWLGTLGP